LSRNLSRRIAAADWKVLLVQVVGESTLIELLELALALFLEE
jgi:hypothetical protein